VWDFLTWLWTSSWKVYWLVRDKFWSLYDVVYNVWTRISQAASDAFRWARDWTADRIADVKATVTGWIDAAKAALWSGIAWAKDLAWQWVQDAIQWVRDQLKIVDGWIDSAIQWLKDTVWQWIEDKIQQLRDDIDHWLQPLKDAIAALDPFKQLLQDLQTIFSPGNLTNFTDFLNRLYHQVAAFFENPISWIFNLLLPYAVSFGSYALGTAMGTVKYDLPPAPSWLLSDPDGPPPPPPPGPTGLVPPLSRLIVRGGNTWNNPPGHYGIDWAPTSPFTIFAAHDGVVEVAGWSTVGYGNNMTVRGSPWWTRYAHLRSIGRAPGDEVRAGDVLGVGDTTGNSTGDHLHFELKQSGIFVNPALYF